MGIREDVLALADDVEGTIGGCYGCLLDKRGLCKAESDFDCNDEVCKFVAHRLRAIAEKDAENVTTVSSYDLLPEDERKAIAWAREHGGLGAVEKRLMPEGMEWPRFEDGETVKFGDEFADGLGNTRKCQSVELLGGDDGVCDAAIRWGEHDCDFMLVCVWQGERVKRPAPKVVDADGVEISVGDTVYLTGYDEPLTVKGFDNDGRVLMDYHNDDSLGYKPSKLTHEQPDTWERLEHDAEKTVCEYFGANYDCANCPLETARCAEEVKKDIIRRAKKLAEGGA